MKKRWLAAALCLCLAVGLLPCSVLAADGASQEVSITTTDIPADVVYNEGGYGSLITRNPRQAALIDRSGAFKFNWRSSDHEMAVYGNIFEDGEYKPQDDAYRRFWYSPEDNVVSFTTSLTWGLYNWEFVSEAEYFHIDGTPAFSLGGNYIGSPVVSGYARIMEQYDKNSTAKNAQIVDKNGRVTCDLPKGCQWTGREVRGDGDGWIMLTHCGEGLFGFVEWGEDETNNLYFKRSGFMDTQGNVVLDLGERYVNVGMFVGDIACAAVEDENQRWKWGFIDKTGKEIIPCQYEACNYNSGLIAVQKNGSWGFIDTTGREVIPFEYNSAFSGPEDLLSVAKNGKYGLIDSSNRVVVPLEYDDISEFRNGVAYAVKNGRVSIITEGSAPEPTPAPAPETPKPVTPSAPAVSFTDVGPGDWHAAAINYVVSRNLMDGTGSGMFSPRAAATRGTVVTALERLNGVNVGDGADPNGAVSREQLVSMLFRSANSPAVSGSLSGFPDASAVSSQAADAMVWAVSNGLVQGDGNGALNPGGSATRAQAATVLMRFCEKFGK